jgi:hypothetical protein
MLRRTWLAVLLGIALGMGLAVAPTSTGSQERTLMQQDTAVAKLEMQSGASYNWQDLPSVLLSLIAGVVAGAPFFLATRKRNR